MPIDPEIDVARASLADGVRQAVLADFRRIVIVGASGWIGRVTLTMLHEALGPAEFAGRVTCFGSQAGVIELDGGLTVSQQPLAELSSLVWRPTLLFHLAFLTKDKVAAMDAAEYVRANRALSQTVRDALDTIGVDRLFVASSGAAASAEDPAAASDLRLYGGMKRADEELFADWAQAAPDRLRAAIGRIYSVSGPYINKLESYALASFILDALAGRPIEVRAPMRVLRSYVALRELVSVVFATLLAPQGASVFRFETGGEALELGDVAACVAQVIGGEVRRRPATSHSENRYVGNHKAWQTLLKRYRISHISLIDQVAETAEYLATQVGTTLLPNVVNPDSKC